MYKGRGGLRRRRGGPMLLVGGTAAFAYGRLVRPWHQRWGATDKEVAADLPGDDLIAEPAFQVTRAISIGVAPKQIWPWVVQLGADRGGFYSYDWLENCFGLGIHSADAIIPEWQERAAGDLMCADAEGTFGWYVMDIQPGRALVVKMANTEKGRPARLIEPPFMEFTWSFVLEGTDNGTTRLIVRERIGFGKRVVRVLFSPVGLISLVMTQKMMRGIKERAENRDHILSTSSSTASSYGVI